MRPRPRPNIPDLSPSLHFIINMLRITLKFSRIRVDNGILSLQAWTYSWFKMFTMREIRRFVLLFWTLCRAKQLTFSCDISKGRADTVEGKPVRQWFLEHTRFAFTRTGNQFKCWWYVPWIFENGRSRWNIPAQVVASIYFLTTFESF